MVVHVLERLSVREKVTRAILLAPGLPREYDLTLALRHTQQGIDSFYSRLDVPIALVFTSMIESPIGILKPGGSYQA